MPGPGTPGAILENGPAGKPGIATAALPAGTQTKAVAVLREESQVGIDMREGVSAVLKNDLFDNVGKPVRYGE